MKLSEIRATLEEIGVSPVKTLGQNFLHDQNLSRWIVDKAGIKPGDFILEIGPGLGALTRVALERGARVLAIEKDGRLANFLRADLPNESLELVHMDALDFDERGLLAQPSVRLLGNLPYNITTPLLAKYLGYPSPISLSLLMLQKEVAQRICAEPGTPPCGALTLEIQFYYVVRYLRTVPPAVFLPQPDVESALVQFVPRDGENIPACDHAVFAELVRVGFSQRRKQLGKLLRPRIGNWPEAADVAGVPPDVRAEVLSLEQWVALANYVAPIGPPGRATVDAEMFPVVDEEDRIVGTAPRRQVHANNLRHRAVHVLIFNLAGELYLQKRTRWKDRHPFRWDSSAAGHVEAGEDYDFTAKRELKEELGISTSLRPVAKLAASEETGQEFIQLYAGEYGGQIEPDAAEIDVGRFDPPDVVTAWIAARPGEFAPGFVACWRAFRAANGQRLTPND
jgi:16S rRNA (adenine1518-N6/adenine1519-N6)-dimethyltransferase